MVLDKQLEGKLKRKERREKAKSLLKKIGIGLTEEEKEVLRKQKINHLKYKIELTKGKAEIAKLQGEIKELNPKGGGGFFSGIGFDPNGQGGRDIKHEKKEEDPKTTMFSWWRYWRRVWERFRKGGNLMAKKRKRKKK